MVALSFEQGLMIQILRYTLVAGGAYIIFWKALDGYFASRRIQKRPLKKNQIAKELMYSG
ncbi:MAG: hypothetical protein KDD51_06920 [Bdellovibrionales bacterium]|nr:hypothetical protein [Bdellovibrionales bacterium]